jgi:hypothetical protein
MTFYGWGKGARTKFFHKLKRGDYPNANRWLDCNSWEREPWGEEAIPNWLSPCPKCLKDFIVERLFR